MILNKKGFTIVETMLAMAFISLLILSIVLTGFQMINMYKKGVAIRDVNQTGRNISLDLQSTLRSGGKISDDDFFVYRNGDKPIYGSLCNGQYSYVWNYGSALNINGGDGNYNIIKFKNSNSNDKNQQLRFVKVKDNSKYICELARMKKLSDYIEQKSAIEIIKPSESELAVHDFNIIRGVEDSLSNQSLYFIDFVIGTFIEPNLLTIDGSCKVGNDQTIENQCAINKFELSIRTVK